MKQPRPLLLACLASIIWCPAVHADVEKKDTIRSLEKKTVAVRPGRVILDSSDLARDNYRAFLDLVTGDPELRAEALRRLGDLELESTEALELAENIEALDSGGYGNVTSNLAVNSLQHNQAYDDRSDRKED